MQDEHLEFWSFSIFLNNLSTLNQAFIKSIWEIKSWNLSSGN